LVDAYHVLKLLSQQLLPFGRSGDELGELTFGVKQFLPLSVRRGRSASLWQTVRGEGCSSCVRRVLAHLRFGWTRFWTVRSRGADSPRVGRQSATFPRTVRFSRGRYWRFCWLFRTVRGSGRTVRRTRADSLPDLAGLSASAWLLCSLV
jgi:hypothetical protein